MIPKVKSFGRIIKAHGVNGEVLIEINQQFEDVEVQPNYLFIDIDGGLVPFQTVSHRYKNYKETIILFDTINTEKQASKLVNSQVFIDINDVDDEDIDSAFSWNLAGFEVFDAKHGFIGKVVSIIEINNNPLLEIDFNNKEILIPLHKEIIVEVDEDKKQININAPEGLIELYLE